MKRRLPALVLAFGCLTSCGVQTSPPSQAPDRLQTPPLQTAQTAQTSLFADGTFTVGMECAYPPYNWAQKDSSNGAVPVANLAGTYANGYDVQFAKGIAQANGWTLEIRAAAWEELIPAVQNGTVDAVIAGQSMTSARMDEVDMIGPYYYAAVVCLTTPDSRYAGAKTVSDLSGGRCTAQSGTLWYDTCLSQIKEVQLQEAAGSLTELTTALTAGTVDFICTDMPTALILLRQSPNLVLLDFTGSGDDFQFPSEEERVEAVNLGISVAKGNVPLADAICAVLAGMDRSDFDAMMREAVSLQPEALE